MGERETARVIVCGGRDFTDYERVASVLDRIHAMRPFWAVWHGNASGADACADRWCRERGVKVFPVPAQWSKFGKGAGPRRNKAMLGQSIDLVIAFPRANGEIGPGTADMIKQARRAGVLVTTARCRSTLRETSVEAEASDASGFAAGSLGAGLSSDPGGQTLPSPTPSREEI